MGHRILSVLVSLSFTAMLGQPILARDLSFEERVQAQRAIERVYYSHQIGATKPFDEAVPRTVLEKKVHTYLQESAALETTWHTPVTAEALENELERIVRSSRLPDRLQEIFAALGNDSFLVEECFARPVLVDRLARSFFANDERIHARAREEARSLRDALLVGAPGSAQPRRTIINVDLDSDDGNRRVGDSPATNSRIHAGEGLRLGPDEFRKLRTSAPGRIGEVGPVVEERNSFVVSVLEDETPAHFQLARYSVPKRSWDEWLRDSAKSLQANQVPAVSTADHQLPSLTPSFRPPAGSTAGVRLEQAVSNEDLHSPCGPDDVWDNGSLDDFPGSRFGHTAVWTGSLMIIWGADGGPITHAGGRYDPLTDTWSPTSSIGEPSLRYQHTAVWTGDLMIVWGGFVRGVASYTNSGGRYDPISDTWSPTSLASAPEARTYHLAVWTGSQMIVWGGFRPNPLPGTDGSLKTGGKYDPSTDTWIATSTVGAPLTHFKTAVWTGSLVLVWGGFNNLNGARYDPVADAWTLISLENDPGGRRGHTAVWTGSRMIIWGGYDMTSDTPLNSGGLYDPLADSWTPTSTTGAPEGRSGATAVWTGSRMVVWGGALFPAGSNQVLNTGGVYDPIADSWTETSLVNAPSARWSNTAIWTGELMVVWGGTALGGFNDVPATGGRYDPATDSWTPTSVGGGPVGTVDHSAVWTGNQMITWGGSRGLIDTNAGSRYDPIVDAWTPTSELNAPLPISSHSAVWTGSLMLVWGGFHPGNPVSSQDGGRYDPATDTWTPISPTNAPFPQDGQVAVWTGRRMIVWGGGVFQQRTTSNFGGVYDPETDRWFTTSMVNAPEARWFASGVWTGSQMIVWGGSTFSGFSEIPLDSGARYDPNTDTWTPTTSTNLPQARHRHTAVWTGSRMIVWGGRFGDLWLNSGALYDPSTDTWAPTSTTNAPSRRASHTAVWTGSLMIVWGGDVGGGRYDPTVDTWTPTSTLDAPKLRSGHSAIWTGNFMLIWGGNIASIDPATDGGRYAVEPSVQIHLTLSAAVLSPANHKMVDIQAIVDAPPVCGASPSVQLTSISSSEPDDAPGNSDGQSVDDIQGAEIGTADLAFQLRAERDRNGPGRTYTVTYSATDAGGHTALASRTVFVPPSGPAKKRLLITNAPAPKGPPRPKPKPKE